MAEWLKAHAWKACVRETVPWVRIPLSPPDWPTHGFLPGTSLAIRPNFYRHFSLELWKVPGGNALLFSRNGRFSPNLWTLPG